MDIIRRRGAETVEKLWADAHAASIAAAHDYTDRYGKRVYFHDKSLFEAVCELYLLEVDFPWQQIAMKPMDATMDY